MQLLLALPLASAFMVSPLAPSHAALAMRAAQPAKMSLVSGIKDSILPKNADQTAANVVGLQMVGWGAGAIVVPNLMMQTIFATTLTGASVPMMRAMGLGMLSGGVRNCNGGDAAAAMDGFIFFGLWTHLLRGAGAAGTLAGYTPAITLINALCALSCARRMGGLFDTITKADTGLLSSILPRDRKLSLRNVLGAQLLGWGVMGAFFQSVMFGPLLMNVVTTGKAAAASGAMLAMLGSGIGIANSIMAGRMFGSNDADAAANGAFMFAGYGIIGLLAKRAGIWTGSVMTACSVFNLAVSAYCVKEMLD